MRDPRLYDATGSTITPMIARQVMADAFRDGYSAGSWAMTQTQKAMVENCSVAIHTITRKVLEDPQVPPNFLTTLCGLMIEFDETLPLDVIELREKSGGTIARIKNLAVPK